MTEPRQIHVARSGVQLGVFTDDEVVAGLAAGRFRPGDLAWTNGLAAWRPLGEWPEFAAAPSASVPSAEPPASLIPWEQRKSLPAFFATFRLALLSPREVISTGRFALGDWMVFCYFALLLALPLSLLGHTAFFSDWREYFFEWLQKHGTPQQRDQFMLAVVGNSLGAKFVGLLIGLVLAPVFYLLPGLSIWLCQGVFRVPASFERTLAGVQAGLAVVLLLAAPLNLLGFHFPTYALASVVLFFVCLVVFSRILGAVTGLSPWKQFALCVLAAIATCVLCCLLPALLLGVLLR
jgi:hypothetical protein